MNSRDVACEVMAAVRERDAYANLELPVVLRRARLSSPDAGFATELTYGTLRMRGLYDAAIAVASSRSVDSIDPTVLDILRLGTHQWMTLATPAHAVVDESASLARRRASKGAVGFVNAVMRRVTERTRDEWLTQVAANLSADDQLAVTQSHPAWIVRALRSALTHEDRADELTQLLEANNEPAHVTLVRLRGNPADTSMTAGKYSPRALSLRGGDPHDVPDVQSGNVRIQDEGSQLAALTLTRAQPIRSGERWLDMCAGPGGKTALLAAEAQDANETVSITANEVQPHRADLVRNAVRGFDNVGVVVGDGRDFSASDPHGFDRILVDAPCSGLGALRRRPESRWRRTPKDVATLTGIQWDLMKSAVSALKPGGLLAYVTCSPHLVETRAIVDRAVRELGVHELSARGVIDGIVPTRIDWAGTDLSAQLWPHRHGTDAMFISLLTTGE